ncbi:unnamed protein product [Mytilus coruscus]|uniref:Uncharacterized protein n=1 Tax=Mytilus coruscus TaxID=42192 RepID=A0A6J8EJ31_MYTCO|nr:unnamed protein product [Mytilus coruscus]
MQTVECNKEISQLMCQEQQGCTYQLKNGHGIFIDEMCIQKDIQTVKDTIRVDVIDLVDLGKGRYMHDKAASTILNMFTNILDDISGICETYRKNDITSHGHSILLNIRNSCCKGLGLISKLITATFWRLIESNIHVLDMKSNYLSQLTYLDRMSKDSTDSNRFITGGDFSFRKELEEKDKIVEKLVKPDEGIDEKACAFEQLAFKDFTKSWLQHLPGGAYFSPTEEIIG